MVRLNIYPVLASWQKNKAGESTIHLSIEINGERAAFPSLKKMIEREFWDAEKKQVKKIHRHAQLINTIITREKNRITEDLLKAEVRFGTLTKEIITSTIQGSQPGSVLEFAMVLIREESNRISDNTMKRLMTEFNRLKEYSGGSLMFSDINATWLRRYEAHFSGSLANNTSLYMAMRRMMQILKTAAARGLFDLKTINDYKMAKYTNPERLYLTLEQTDLIADKVYNGSMAHDKTMLSVACFFLVECWAGIRFSDWSRFSTEKLIDNDSLKIPSTQKNKTPVYIPLSNSPRLARILDFIRDNDIKFKVTEKHTNNLLKIIAPIAGIPMRLTTHVGRHTCATLLLELGYTSEAIAQWLGISRATVDIYARQTRRKIMNEYQKLGGL